MDVNTLKLLNQLEGAKPVIRPGQKLRTCEAPLSRFAVVQCVTVLRVGTSLHGSLWCQMSDTF